MFARLSENVVIEIWDIEELPPLHPDVKALYVPCDNTVEVGDLYEAQVFSKPSVEE